jgi:hypothetical protein
VVVCRFVSPKEKLRSYFRFRLMDLIGSHSEFQVRPTNVNGVNLMAFTAFSNSSLVDGTPELRRVHTLKNQIIELRVRGAGHRADRAGTSASVKRCRPTALHCCTRTVDILVHHVSSSLRLSPATLTKARLSPRRNSTDADSADIPTTSLRVYTTEFVNEVAARSTPRWRLWCWLQWLVGSTRPRCAGRASVDHSRAGAAGGCVDGGTPAVCAGASAKKPVWQASPQRVGPKNSGHRSIVSHVHSLAIGSNDKLSVGQKMGRSRCGPPSPTPRGAHQRRALAVAEVCSRDLKITTSGCSRVTMVRTSLCAQVTQGMCVHVLLGAAVWTIAIGAGNTVLTGDKSGRVHVWDGENTPTQGYACKLPGSYCSSRSHHWA